MNTLSLDSIPYQSSSSSVNLAAESINSNPSKVKDQYAEEKRIRRLVRNREAAKRNRLKKKEWINGLQSSNSKIIDINSNLASRIVLLQEELTTLQNLLYQAGYEGHSIPKA